MTVKLSGKIMAEFKGLGQKHILIEQMIVAMIKKLKEQINSIIKGRLKFEDSEECLQNNKITLNSQQRTKTKAQHAFTKEINKIALSSNDDKILQTFQGIISYPYGASAGK